MKHKIMANVLKSAIFLSITIYPAFAMNEHPELEITKITSINQVLQVVQNIRKLHPNDFIAAAFDWDETISHSDGEERNFREESTKKVVEKIVEKFDVKPFILTARYAGTDLDDLEDAACEKFKLQVSAMANRMYDALPILERSSVLRTGGKIRHFRMADENGTNTIMFKDSIVFAGSHTQTRSIKGKFLARFMERSYKAIDHLVFVDDNLENILDAQEAFKNHPDRHKVTLLYYPHISKRVIYSLYDLRNIKPEVLRGFPDAEKDKLIKYDNFLTLDQREAIGVR